MNNQTTRHGGIKRLVILVLCLITVLVVAWRRIPDKQTNSAPKQEATFTHVRYWTANAYLDRVSSHDKSDGNICEEDLLTMIQKQSWDVTCFPIELVIYDRMVHEYYDFEYESKLAKQLFGDIDESQDKTVLEHKARFYRARRHYDRVRLFRTDRYLDLTFETYLPLSRIIKRAKVATQDDIQRCLDFLPIASSKERALIFVAFYLYIEKLYRDNGQWGADPIILDEDTEQFVNKLIKTIRKKASSKKVAFYAYQYEPNDLARQWQVSFRRLFWNVMSDNSYHNHSIFLTDGPRPWIEVTLNSPDTFLYSILLMNVNSAVRESPQAYYTGLPLFPLNDIDNLNEFFSSRTDTALSYLNGYGGHIGNNDNMSTGVPRLIDHIPDPRIQNALYYPQRAEILKPYDDLLISEENLLDEAREYLLSQFFYLRIGNNRRPQATLFEYPYNEVANQDDITVGEVATRLLEEIDFITTPISVEDD